MIVFLAIMQFTRMDFEIDFAAADPGFPVGGVDLIGGGH